MGISVDELFTLRELDAQAIFGGVKHPWEVLTRINTFIFEYAKTLPNDFERIEEFIWVGKGTTIEKSVLIKGPTVIGYNCEIRHSAYIRENVIIGNNVVVGNSTEIKNSILFNKVQVPHYNYVSDSILGYKSHLGAGAILGDSSEVGCNTVLNPGTIVGKGSIVYPLCSVRGYIPENSILKNSGEIVERKQS